MSEQDSGWRRDQAPQHVEQAGTSLAPGSAPTSEASAPPERPPSSGEPEQHHRSPYASPDQPGGLAWPPPAASHRAGQDSPGDPAGTEHHAPDTGHLWSQPGSGQAPATGSAGGYPTNAGGYPTASYPGGVGAPPVSGAAGQPTSGYPAAGYPVSGAGYPTAQYPDYHGGQPGSGAPGGPAGPVQGGNPGAGFPGGYQPGQPKRGRGGLIALLVIAAIVLTVGSGTIGGLVAHQNSAGGGTKVIRESVPDIPRDSVAGIAGKVLPSVVDITTDEGEGSGVILSADGAIVTNNHVVEGATGNTVNVTFSTGKTAKATIVGTDPAGDIAVIKAQGVTGLTAASFGDSDGMRVGDTVLAIGSPLGLQGSVSEGIISALHRTISEGATNGQSARSISDALQTDAAINPGNSGGALINLNGQVIGINTAIATSGQQSSGNIGVGFAISSNRVKAAADLLLKGGKVSHPYLGVGLTDGQSGGALIANVVAGGPADKAGLQKGDVVLQADGQNVADSTALINAIQSHKVGDQVHLSIQRNGAQQQITVTLGETPQ